ncbi:MAG TPA: NifB/NifX family molybdenum-iron cluster-binding protein [Candidatus Limnocylindria bacterium]|nr:NifB/NifX family molybdenum-iron cluster-binding protein [Candidatus Limnocylindria bacterium]
MDPRWGRAARVALATVAGDTIQQWQEIDVHWEELHDAGGEGQHHARVARFLQENGVQAVVAAHMGAPMEQMLRKMGIALHLGASGIARDAVARVLGSRGVTG